MVLFLTILTGALLLIGSPIFIGLLSGAVATIWWYAPVSMVIIVQTLFGSIDKFELLAIPFFIYAALLMDRGGLARRLIAWADNIFCLFRGALGFTTIASCELFGAISGSSPATVIAVGNILYPALQKGGYSSRFSLGLVTASGCIGIIIPPSIAMIIFASITNASVGALFMGGIGAGLLFGACFAVYVYFYSLGRKFPEREKLDVKKFIASTRESSWALGAPIIIIGGIYSGMFTPTEAAGVVAVYSLLVTMFVYREISWGDLVEVTADAAVLTAKIMIILAASGIFAWLLTIGNGPQLIKQLFSQSFSGQLAVLLMINVTFLIAGMFLDPNSAQVILVPLIYPVALAAGVDLIHLGVIITTNLAIGMYTPPFGLNLFVAQSVFGVSYKEVVISVLPFIVIGIVALALITWIPAISLALPHFVYAGS